MSSGQDDTTVDDLFEVLKLRDGDWLLETLKQRWAKLQMSYQAKLKTVERPLQVKRSAIDEGLGDAISPFDVTRPEQHTSNPVSDHVRFFQQLDWSATPLGPLSTWSPILRRWVNFVMTDPRGSTLWWGPKHICIYNAEYARLIADKHPYAMGKTVREFWPDRAETQFEAVFRKADATGQASRGEQKELFTIKGGGVLEAYGDWSIIPISGDDGNLGFFNSIGDLTKYVQHERQISTLMAVEKETSLAKDLNSFWRRILRGLEPNEREAPFAALYSSMSRHCSSRSSASTGIIDMESILASRSWELQGTLGTESIADAFPECIRSEWAEEYISSSFRSFITNGQIQSIDLEPGSLIYTAAKSRAYNDQCKQAILCPIGRAQDGDRIGFLILGINSRRPYDDKYEHFARLLSKQLTVLLPDIKELEDEARKANAAAELDALDRRMLSEKLEAAAQETREQEARFRSIASHLPIAFYEVSPSGEILFGNDAYYDITGLDKDTTNSFAFLAAIKQEDFHIFEEGWSRLLRGEAVSFEHRMNKRFIEGETSDGKKIEGDTWILSAAFAHKRFDGTVSSIQGAPIDISRQRWMEAYQSRKLAEAMELKRQQEQFMDFVGHEIRNPLSATSLCASSILAALEDLMPTEPTAPVHVDRETIQSQMENAEIITTCIQHQKRIIDDVLTLSKLDTGLLIVTPCETKPVELVGQSLRLFDAELQQADMQIALVIDQSYRDAGIEWTLLDPSRLLQILINLVTNAIRFTKNRKKRVITVTMSASKERPTHSPTGTTYLVQPNSESGTSTPEHDDENTFFLMLAVQDTGVGMKPHELQRIFERFQQSSHKTHIEYGGSGLGLFISRELARLQGGQIGVASTHGKGSTFEFYIRANKCPAPDPSRGREGSSSTVISSRTGSTSLTPCRIDSTIPNPFEIQLQYLLLVEDNLVNQKVMEKQLKKAGYNIKLANHGGEALEHLRRSTFCDAKHGQRLDVVLMDVEMPIMGGLECTRKIREMQEKKLVASGKHVPIIAITANARGEQQTQALDAGMDSVVTKPFQMKELLGEMERVFRLSMAMGMETCAS